MAADVRTHLRNIARNLSVQLAHVVLQSRVQLPKSSRRQTNNWFMAMDVVEALKTELMPWGKAPDSAPLPPLAIDVVLIQPGRESVLLETWLVRCETNSDSAAVSAMNVPLLYKTVTVLMRAVALFLRLLPAHKLRLFEQQWLDAATMSGQRLDAAPLTLSYKLRQSHEPGVAGRLTFHEFPTLTTPLGAIRTEVWYVAAQDLLGRKLNLEPAASPKTATSMTPYTSAPISGPLGANLIDDYVSDTRQPTPLRSAPVSMRGSAAAGGASPPHAPDLFGSSPPFTWEESDATAAAARLGLRPEGVAYLARSPPMHASPADLGMRPRTRSNSFERRSELTVVASAHHSSSHHSHRASMLNPISPLRHAPIDPRGQQGDAVGRLPGSNHDASVSRRALFVDDSPDPLLGVRSELTSLEPEVRTEDSANSELGAFVQQCRAALPLDMFQIPHERSLSPHGGPNVTSGSSLTTSNMDLSGLDVNEALIALRSFHLSDV